MSTNTKQSYKLSVKKATRRRQQQQQRRRTTTRSSITSSIGYCNSLSCRGGRNMKMGVQIEGTCKSKLSQKLEALKNLIPTHNAETVKPDQLFKETADYIVLLRTRVLVLQKLIEYYGDNTENENVVLL